MPSRRLNILTLEVQDHGAVLVVDVEPHWLLVDLQKALEKSFVQFHGQPLDRIMVAVPAQFFDATDTPILTDLVVSQTKVTYKDVPLVVLGSSRTIVSYFPSSNPGDGSKIHLIVYTGQTSPSNLANTNLAANTFLHAGNLALTRDVATTTSRRLNFLAPFVQDSNIQTFYLDVPTSWNLFDLREALETRFIPFHGQLFDQIKVLALSQYLDFPHTADPTALVLGQLEPTYRGVQLTGFGPAEGVVSRFPPFEPGDEMRIHLIVYIEQNTADATMVSSEKVDANSAVHGNLIRLPDSDNLMQYYRHSWGAALLSNVMELPTTACDGMVVDETSSDDGGDLLPGQPIITSLLTGVPVHLLVRAEYIRIYDAVELVYNVPDGKNYPPAVVITGQPGIGKSMWIHYAMRRRLALKKPTIWYMGKRFYRFTEQGVFEDRDPNNDFRNTSKSEAHWCFIDSSEANDGIPSPMSGSGFQGVFPIYVTSPKVSRWKHLHQSRSRKLLFMNPWTLQEMEAARVLYPDVDLDKVQRRFYELGPTARLCLEYTDSEEAKFKDDRSESIATITMTTLESILVNAKLLLDQDDMDSQLTWPNFILIRRQGLVPNTLPAHEFITKSVARDILLRVNQQDRSEHDRAGVAQFVARFGKLGRSVFEAYHQDRNIYLPPAGG